MANATEATKPWKSQSDSGATRQQISNYTNPRRGLKIARANAALIAAQRAVFNQQSARRPVPSRSSNDPLKYSSLLCPFPQTERLDCKEKQMRRRRSFNPLLVSQFLEYPRNRSLLISNIRLRLLAWISHNVLGCCSFVSLHFGLFTLAWRTFLRLSLFVQWSMLSCNILGLKTQERVLLKTLPTGEGYGAVYAKATYWCSPRNISRWRSWPMSIVVTEPLGDSYYLWTRPWQLRSI